MTHIRKIEVGIDGRTCEGEGCQELAEIVFENHPKGGNPCYCLSCAGRELSQTNLLGLAVATLIKKSAQGINL